MMTFEQFATQLERAIATFEPHVEVGLIEVGKHAQELAKSYIGEEHEKWPDLAESTIRDKAAHGFKTPAPLLRTGHMRESIKIDVNPGALSVTVGSDEKIAKYQEMGTSRIPPRPFLSMAMQNTVPFAVTTFGHIAVAMIGGKAPKR